MTSLALALLLSGSPVRPVATYSIVARDPQTGQMGVAVQSHWFSVGSMVSWAEAGVGAVATQSFVDPSYGPLGLDLMRSGKAAPEALRHEYEGRYGAEADRKLRQALAVGDRKELVAVVRQYEATRAGLRTILALADDALLRGRPAEARLLLARIPVLHAADGDDPALRRRRVLAAARDHAEGGPAPREGETGEVHVREAKLRSRAGASHGVPAVGWIPAGGMCLAVIATRGVLELSDHPLESLVGMAVVALAAIAAFIYARHHLRLRRQVRGD